MRDYKDIAKTNTFIAHAKEIQAICVENGVDIGIAADMWLADNNIERTIAIMGEYADYREFCREDTLNAIVAELDR